MYKFQKPCRTEGGCIEFFFFSLAADWPSLLVKIAGNGHSLVPFSQHKK